MSNIYDNNESIISFRNIAVNEIRKKWTVNSIKLKEMFPELSNNTFEIITLLNTNKKDIINSKNKINMYKIIDKEYQYIFNEFYVTVKLEQLAFILSVILLE